VYDGHGGRGACEFAAITLHKVLADKLNENEDPAESLKNAFIETNNKMKDCNVNGGTTALVSLFMSDKIYIANAGDSRAVIYNGRDIIRCSTDHKPDLPEEEERVKALGGVVTKTVTRQGKTIGRVGGMLAVSRALGDLFLQPFVTPEPQVHVLDYSTVQILIMACDGIWDVTTDEEAINIVLQSDDPEDAAVKLRDNALNKGSTDNITVAVVYFPNTPSPNTLPLPRKASLPSESRPVNTHDSSNFISVFVLIGIALVAYGVLRSYM